MQRRPLNLDRIGTVASGICAVHCVLTGLALGVLSTIGFGFIGNPLLDKAFLAVATGVGLGAAILGFKRHRNFRPGILAALGFLMLIISHFGLSHDHRHESQAGHVDTLIHLLSAAGGCALVAFHIWNHRLTQRACRCGKPGCDLHP